ncbi:uncharacterized protein LOC117321072 [Pecten maximus]|uniref:uncharacterized protein LOC117321072 n=1 Tax=Pecten maximus TaxID=6579 RepID=UPI001458A4AA|nr:uncharacterized protein LOC117321072 [Pecten maximus]
MATPVKETDRIRFPDSDRCVSCCLENKQRYYIIRKDKNKGPAFEIVCYCYKNNLCIEENVGTYVCSPCYKLLLRIKDMDCRRSQLYDKVMMSSQTFIKVISVKKRSMAIGTPGTPRQSKFPDKRATPDQGSLEKQSRQQTVIRKPSTRSLFLTPSKKASSSFTEDLAVPFSPGPQSSNQQKRIKSSSLSVKKTLKHTVSFRSSKLCEQMLPIVKSLANGSFKKALSLLVNSSDHATKENAKKAVKKLIEQECCVFSKQTNEFEVHLQKRETRDLENFNMKEIQKDFESHAPMLWACATQAATSGYSKTFDQVKVCAALCVLLQGRSKMLNSLQHVVAITMYNNQLQKDGFSVLAKLGFSVTHTTLNEKLNTAKKLNEQVMKTYQRRLADTIAAKSIVDRVSTEHSYAGGLDQPSVIDEHSYSTIYHSEFQQHGEPLGYRFNLDNLDFHIKVREMTQEHQNVSRHFTQIMSVVDRVSCEGFTDEPVGNLMEVENSEFLPTAEDNYTLRKDMIQVVSNILIEHLSSFKIFENICPKQFQHAYSAEMSKKSIVVYYICHIQSCC